MDDRVKLRIMERCYFNNFIAFMLRADAVKYEPYNWILRKRFYRKRLKSDEWSQLLFIYLFFTLSHSSN